MQSEVIITNDGSPTLYVAELDEHYHSIHGAFNESMHVFINAGLLHQIQLKSALKILEVGLGTGSNVLLTNTILAQYTAQVQYDALEPFPINAANIAILATENLQQYGATIPQFKAIHEQLPQIPLPISEHLTFRVFNEKLEEVILEQGYDLIYFDAFGPRAQPEIWSIENFKKLYDCLNTNGTLVTYCAKGEVRRTMQTVGFEVERLPGPPGKREMLRATKK